MMLECRIIPATEAEANEHKRLVEERFLGDLEKWEHSVPTYVELILGRWPLIIGLIAGCATADWLTGSAHVWTAIACVCAFGIAIAWAKDDRAKTRGYRKARASVIRFHAKWKIDLGWTDDTSDTGDLAARLSRLGAPDPLRIAVHQLAARHPGAEFQLEAFDVDPILSVRLRTPFGTETQIVGIWGLPEKFTFV